MKIPTCFLILMLPVSGQFVIPESRREPGSDHLEWDRFTEAKFLPNEPDVVGDSEASITSSTGSAFITSSGNLYSFQSPISLQLDDTTDLEVRSVFLQLSTLGSGMDLSSIRLLAEDAEKGTTAIAPDRTFVAGEEELTGEFGGTGTLYGIQWDLRERPLTGRYTILFKAASTSLSIDKVSLDLSERYVEMVKPEPLSVRLAGDEVVVSWFGSRRLQTSDTLKGEWTNLPGTEGVNEIRLPVREGSSFFRLVSTGDAP